MFSRAKASFEKFEFMQDWFPKFQTMHRSLRKEMKELRSVQTPPEKNFSIEYSNTQGHENLKLSHQESGEIIDIATLLPPGYTLASDTKFEVYKKTVFFNLDELGCRGFLLSLFHEIGHCVAGDTTSNPHNIESVYASLFAIIRRKVQKIFQRPEDFQYDMNSCLPLWYVEKTHQDIALMERNAWAYSLKKLRELDKQGWEVFAGFESNTEIQEHISYNLISYELDYMLKCFVNIGFHADTPFKPIGFIKTQNHLKQRYHNILSSNS